MKRLLPVFALFCLGFGSVANGDNNSLEPPRYEVVRTDVAPTLDGIVTEGEWDLAKPAAGDWVDLLSHTPDSSNLRFRMLWDDENLYILGQTDYAASDERAGFPAGQDLNNENPDLRDDVYSPRMIFDPNADGEDYAAEDFNPLEPDGYSILWSVSEDFAARYPTPGNPSQEYRDPLDETGLELNWYIPGFELEANVNSLSGNNGGWDTTVSDTENYRDDKHPGITFAQLAIDDPLDETEQPGAVFEFAISWSSFNATDPNSGDPLFDPESEEFLENGLYHPMAPEPNDEWGFEFGVKDPDGGFSSWSEPMGGNEARETFASWEAQHGRIIFTEQFPEFDCDLSGAVDLGDLMCMTAETKLPTLEILNLIDGDLNGDGRVNFPDFLVLSQNFGSPVDNYTEGDINIDGTVSFPDFLVMSQNFGMSSPEMGQAASVPEPNGLLLLTLGLLALRRRR